MRTGRSFLWALVGAITLVLCATVVIILLINGAFAFIEML